MAGMWRTATMDVEVDFEDFERARERAIEEGRDVDVLTVRAEVDIDEALEEASVDQLREALGREEPGYTQEQIDAIRDCFAAYGRGDTSTASALLGRIFSTVAQINAAEDGMRAASSREAA